jgi:Cu2+-exporting ATPase
MMTLIAVAISVAYGYSTLVVFRIEGRIFFWELATLIDVMLLGHWIEMKSVIGASRALEELVKIMPTEAHLKKNGDIVDVKVEELEVGDSVLVKPGEKIPIDGIVIDGETSVNQAMITGESKPVPKSKGEEVIGGAINGEGSIVVEVEKTGEDTYLNQVVEMVSEAQKSKSKTQDIANKAAFWLTLISISVGIITFTVWMLLLNDLAYSIERTATVMVITCPHALGLAIPLVVARSTSLAATSGLLIRDRQSFEFAKNIEAIIFDKTGTLTQGEFGVTDIIELHEYNREGILAIAGSLETNSEHPIGQGIVNSMKQKDIPLREVNDFKAILGKGIKGSIKGVEYKVVSPGYLEENDLNQNWTKVEDIKQQGKTIVYLLKGENVIGGIALADMIREESKEAIQKL